MCIHLCKTKVFCHGWLFDYVDIDYRLPVIIFVYDIGTLYITNLLVVYLTCSRNDHFCDQNTLLISLEVIKNLLIFLWFKGELKGNVDLNIHGKEIKNTTPIENIYLGGLEHFKFFLRKGQLSCFGYLNKIYLIWMIRFRPMLHFCTN